MSLRLSVIAPVLNEEFFIPLYLESVLAYADEVILLDGGSSDRTVEIIKSFQAADARVKLFIQTQTGTPYSNDWNEGERRNFLLDQATGDWVLALDADEFLSDNISQMLPAMMNDPAYLVYGFRFLPFWKDHNTLRVNDARDPHWAGEIYRMWRRGLISYSADQHHCGMEAGGKRLWEQPQGLHLVPEVALLHYHYALGPRIKFNDNRRGDVNMYNNEGEPDWDYHHNEYDIRTVPYLGEHPRVIRNYLSGKSLWRGAPPTELSIIIVSWNVREYLRRCLDSIKKKATGFAYEVLVIDNGSSDGTADMLRSEYPQVRLISNQLNFGYAAAQNQGLRLATGQKILFLNPDAEVHDQALQVLSSYLDQEPTVGAVGALLLQGNGQPQLSYGKFPTVFTLLYRYFTVHAAPSDQRYMELLGQLIPQIQDVYKLLASVPAQFDHPEEVDYVAGAALMTTRAVIDRIGLFDEQFFAYFEETDWCLRCRQQNFKVVYHPGARIIHHLAASFNQYLARDAVFFRSMVSFARKHFGLDAARLMVLILARCFRDKVVYFRKLHDLGRGDYSNQITYYQALFQTCMEAWGN